MSDSILEQSAEAAALVAVDGKRYPLESARLVGRAEGGVALSTLVQKYANPYDEPLEVIYTMPLPADGAVTGYTVRVGERVIRSEVQPREKASEAYKQALFEGRTAGLLEQSRPDTFQQRLGNVPARTAVEVTIDVLHPLAFLTAVGAADPVGAAPQWEYRFPTVAGVRYHGAPGRVPDAKDLSPDRGADGSIPARMELQLTIADGVAPGAPVSPSHALDVTAGEAGCVVAFREGERLDRDVVVRWPAAAAEVGVRLVEGAGLAGDDGRYALVTVVPPAAPSRVYARDLTLLVDASGSMTGQPLELAKRVAGELLRSLRPGDRFELISFANEAKHLTRGFVPADRKQVAHGLELLRALRADGGTDMLAGIAEAMKPARGDAQRQVVLVTDGQIGFERDVVARVADEANVRLHAVGVGAAPNRSLTQMAAFAGRGIELIVTNEADADAAARRLVAATAAPVLARLAVSGSALGGEQSTRLRDVFAGRPLLFTLELSPSGGEVELSGEMAGQAWSHRVEVPAATGTPARTPLPLGALHGRALVAEYEIGERMDWGDTLRDEHRIERCAMRHRIASSATSLVAIAEEPSVDPRAPRRRERLAVELPHGVSAEGVGLELPVAMTLQRRIPADRARLRFPMKGTFTDVFKRKGTGGGDLPELAGDSAELRAAYRRRVPESLDVPATPHWLDEEILVLEFECPADGFGLAAAPATVIFVGPSGWWRASVEVDATRSSLGSGFPRRMLLRVAFLAPKDLPAGMAGVARLTMPALGPGPSEFALVFELPPRPAAAAGDQAEPPAT